MSGDGIRVGVDVGGTFTDLVTVRDGRVHVHKTPSTPDAPEVAVVEGLGDVAARLDVPLSAVDFLGHGTTVATNAVLEGEWADTALVTTEGFRDALEIGRQDRPDLYDFRAEKPDPVVPRDRRYEVPERLDERGDVLTPLDEDAVREVGDAIAADDAVAVAVSFLFAFENDAHERRVRDLLGEAGLDVPVSLSSEVLPEMREYERTLATALNAALRPVMDEYLGRLADRVRERGVEADLLVMQSGGGVVTAADARARPVTTLLSGPAAGVRGATHVADRAGFADLLTMDMGGTSCDVSLVDDGDPLTSTETTVGDYPVGVPSVDVHTVGSGGGSVAGVDEGGALRVGPRSAGADPGPVCYGRGGADPTLTDAHALLGRVAPERFLDDPADESAVREALAPLAERLGRDVESTAQGVLDVANANMARALRVVSVERGRDPREFTLVAFGGAGPLHATALAADLGVPRVLVPRTAGVLSALGLLASDVTYDRSRSMVRSWDDVDPAALDDAFADLASAGRERLDAAGVPPARRSVERAVDLRYAGQSFDLTVPVPADLDGDALDDAERRFHDRHERRYGHADPDEPVELAAVRARARGEVSPPDLDSAPASGTVADARVETRSVGFDGSFPETPVYDRDRLPAGGTVEGPAVVEGGASTLAVHPGQAAEVDERGNLLVEVDG